MSRSIAVLLALLLPAVAAAENLLVGVARVDVTPATPIRLCGYAARKSESEGVEQKLYARAMAIGVDRENACVLVTLDNTAVSREMTQRLAKALAPKGISPERLVLAATHTHAAPLLAGTIPNMFGHDLPADQLERIEAYTKLVNERIEEAANAAIADMKAATLSFGQGEAKFAANRRTKDGPVDRAMPLLVARGADGKVQAIVANYACHCTTLGSDFNKANGDWAGYASQYLEEQNPGAVALITIGTGADANPSPRGKLEQAQAHGNEIAAESTRLMKGQELLRPIDAAPAGKAKSIELAFDKLPTKEEWTKLAERKDAVGHNARRHLAKIEKGERIDERLPYTVKSWTFGEQLAWVFLPGEVVVDYGLRLKHDFDANRLIVTAYANDVPCYIPSRRILQEGGYEAEGAMTYYGLPGRLAPAVENDIVRAVHEIVPLQFRTKQSLEEFPPPKAAADVLKAFVHADELTVDLVAAEPLVQSPVAIDWDLAGRLWVVEMLDYPSGMNGNGSPGGRIKVLSDNDGDGKYDEARVFLEGLSFPQGVMCWDGGALICAAPDILFAKDTDNDGKADVVKKLFTGFSADNQQWEVNGLTWGLDGWIYGASSIHNDVIKCNETGKSYDLGARDFRFHPRTLAFEPASGRTQYGRVRDDYGNWFGNENSMPLWHYPLEERYVRRNPHAPTPPARSPVNRETRLYPASRTLARFNQPESANHITSACGPGIYRDEMLTRERLAFYCEPVHNLVRALALKPVGPTFAAARYPSGEREFLSSTDNWFRPVQVRTGPDGALWVVDLYRFVVEHPRWITPERLKNLDTRAGAEKGRIYRVYRKDAPPRKMEDLSKVSAAELAKRMDSPNGPLRDLIHIDLVRRNEGAKVLERVARESRTPAARLQSMHALDHLGGLNDDLIREHLGHDSSELWAGVVRLAETRLRGSILDTVAASSADGEAVVAFQVALALGESEDARVSSALAKIALRFPTDPWIRAAVVNSSLRAPLALLRAIRELGKQDKLEAYVADLSRLIVRTGDSAAISQLLSLEGIAISPSVLAELLEELQRRRIDRSALDTEAANRIEQAVARARETVVNAQSTEPARLSAIALLGVAGEIDGALAEALLAPQSSPATRGAAIAAIAKTNPAPILSAWATLSPALRAQAIDLLTTRTVSIDALLVQVESGNIASNDIPAATRQKLLTHTSKSIKDRAAKAFAATRPPRTKALESVRPALNVTGNPDRGGPHFNKLCASCHALHGQGHALGPDLAALTDRSTQFLLTAIVDPNAAVEGKFVAYNIDTTDDRSLTGLVAEESAAGLVIAMPSGMRETVARGAIATMSSTKLSLMPEGLEEGMSPQDLADLIAYVQRAGGK